jgi:hypothetical protein
VLNRVACLFPCCHTAKNVGDPPVVILRKDTCCEACLEAGVTVYEHGFIRRDFLQMPGQFSDIDVVRIADMADSASVPDVPHIQDKRGADFELLPEFLY